jgi:hypothetical protein
MEEQMTQLWALSISEIASKLDTSTFMPFPKLS